MAAATKARAAVSQRTAHRYFVPEDANRALKLSSYYLSSVSSSQTPPPPPPNNRCPLPKEKSLYSSDSRWWHPELRAFTNSFQFVENPDATTTSTINNSLSKESSFELVDIKKTSDGEVEGELPWWQITGKDDPVSKPEKVVTTICKGPKETGIGERELLLSKGKILEALMHSQTRAREAEIKAKEASAQKEHLMKLFFNQASELFACRQWIYLLQLENLYYQIHNNNNKFNPMSAAVSKNGKLQRKKQVKKGKLKRLGIRGGGGGVVFAMGLGFVGAGLLFGWTLGWMLML